MYFQEKKQVNGLIFQAWSIFLVIFRTLLFIYFIPFYYKKVDKLEKKWKTLLSVVVSEFIKYHRKARSLKPAQNLGSGVIRWPHVDILQTRLLKWMAFLFQCQTLIYCPSFLEKLATWSSIWLKYLHLISRYLISQVCIL